MTEPDSTARPEETSVDAPFDKSSSPAVTFRPPPWYVLLIVLGSVGVITAAQMTDVLGDRAIANILTLILGFISVVTFSIWFSVHSQLPRTVRLGYAVAVLGAFAAFIACFRISGVYGDLVPKFRLRFSRDVEMTRATSEAQVTVFIEPSGRDFPQFLGPHRNGVVSDVELIDWNKSKPTELWRKRVGAGWSPFSVLGDYAATMEQRGDGEVVACYRIRTGEEIWSQVTPGRHYSFFGGLGPRTAPSWDGQRLYTLGGFGALQCLEGATGKVIWRDDLLKRYKLTPEVDQTIVFWGRANSPLVVDDLVVVPAGGTDDNAVSLVAFDKETGEVAWEAGDEPIGYSSPVVGVIQGRRQIVSVNEASVTGHDVETGSVLWRFEWPGSSSADANCSQPHILSDSRVLVSKGYSQGAALIRIDEQMQVKQLWANRRVLKTKFTNAVIHNDFVYGLSDSILECVELNSGKRRWKGGRYGHGQILLVGDRILVQCESGEVVMVKADPEQRIELGSVAAMTSQTWNNLCFTSPFLLVRNAEEAVCYRLRTSSSGP